MEEHSRFEKWKQILVVLGTKLWLCWFLAKIPAPSEAKFRHATEAWCGKLQVIDYHIN